jgi:hypothetical protein
MNNSTDLTARKRVMAAIEQVKECRDAAITRRPADGPNCEYLRKQADGNYRHAILNLGWLFAEIELLLSPCGPMTEEEAEKISRQVWAHSKGADLAKFIKNLAAALRSANSSGFEAGQQSNLAVATEHARRRKVAEDLLASIHVAIDEGPDSDDDSLPATIRQIVDEQRKRIEEQEREIAAKDSEIAGLAIEGDRMARQLSCLESWQDTKGRFYDLLNPECEVQGVIDKRDSLQSRLDALPGKIDALLVGANLPTTHRGWLATVNSIRRLVEAARNPKPSKENGIHKLGCDEYHQHHAPACCDGTCWCRTVTAELVSESAQPIKAVPLSECKNPDCPIGCPESHCFPGTAQPIKPGEWLADPGGDRVMGTSPGPYTDAAATVKPGEVGA